MEDLWRLKKMAYRIDDLAGKAEYDLMVRRFRGEEEKGNRDRLLFGVDRLAPLPEPPEE